MSGIKLASGFDLSSPVPLDSRQSVDNLAARDAIPLGVRYEGMTVYVKSEKKQYWLKGGVENSNFVESGNSEVTQELTETTKALAEQLAQTKTIVETKATSTEVETALTLKRDKSTRIKSEELDISTDSNKIKLINLSDEVQQALTGNAPALSVIENEAITKEKIAENAIDFFKHTQEVPIVFKSKPVNLFDKKSAIVGFEVSRTTGALRENSLYAASDFIAVEELADYSRSAYTGAWYDNNKTFISGFVYNIANPIVAPATAKYLRVSVSLDQLDTYMVVQGDALPTTYEPYFTELKIPADEYLKESSLSEDVLSTSVRDKLNKTTVATPREIFEKMINDPTRSINIKLLGDSITHGSGGTGYAENGDFIPGTTVQMNPNGYCWANSLRDLMARKFGGWNTISINNERVNLLTTNYIDNTQTSGNYQFRNNVANQKLFSFEFNGEELKIMYNAYVNGGIVNVFVDGVQHSTIDAYSATPSNMEHLISLPKGQHKIELIGTNTKNASSGAFIFTFQGVKVKRQVNVINYAQSGKNSSHFYNQRETVIEDTDDIVFMQVGTNDRHNLPSTDDTKRYQREIIKTAYSKGAKVILMSACPATVSGDNETIRHFGMFDVDKAIRELAYEYNMRHISNYDAFLEFSEYRGINMDTLFADGLHPNDAGYDVMFRNILRNLGLSYIRNGVNK